MSTFASELQAALVKHRQTLGDSDDTTDALYDLLAKPDSLRRRIVLRILERRAAHYLQHEADGYGVIAGAIDWSQVPWEAIITGLLKVLLMILPFIL